MRGTAHLDFSGFTRLEVAVAVLVVGFFVVMMAPHCGDIIDSPVRERVSRAKTDLRSLATALEAYHNETGSYPVSRPLTTFAKRPERLSKAGGAFLTTSEPGRAGVPGLTTPIAYITSLFPDPFAPEKGLPFAYFTDGAGWILLSAGPDRKYQIVPERDYDGRGARPGERLIFLSYDPTNGLTSRGDIWRVKQ